MSLNRLILVVSVLFFTLQANLSAAVQDGLQDPGFEQGQTYWQIDSQADTVSFVGTEGATTSPTYADNNIEVKPKSGQKMLRLGSPKQISESMSSGSNRVSQTFKSYSSSISFSFWLFSWEHRERDTFTFDVKQTSAIGKTFTVSTPEGSPLSVSMDNQPAQSCSQTPCVLMLESGMRGDLINTGWQRVVISGLPTDGSEVTLSYDLSGLGDEAHPSWGYVDAWKRANFTVSREADSDGIAATAEGNVTRFVDISEPVQDTLNNQWTIYKDGQCYRDEGAVECKVVKNARQVSVISSDESVITAKLVVFDENGESDSLESGQPTPDGRIAPSIDYQDIAPLVSNLANYQVVAGTKGNKLTVRYADPGWDDNVDVSWEIASGDGVLQQDQKVNYSFKVPMLLKGVAAIPFDAPDQAGTTTVNVNISSDGKLVTRNINISVLPASDFVISSADDGNDTPETATLLASNQVVAGHLNKLGDVDFYKLTDANGNNFPEGTEVAVRLSNFGIDHDLFLVSQKPQWPNNLWSQVLSDDLQTGLDNVDFGDLAFTPSSIGGALATTFSSIGGALAYTPSSIGGALATTFSSIGGALAYTPSSIGGALAFTPSSIGGALAYTPSSIGGALAYTPSSIGGALAGGTGTDNSIIFSISWYSELTTQTGIQATWQRDSDLEVFPLTGNGLPFDQLPLSESVFLPLGQVAVTSKDIPVNAFSLYQKLADNYTIRGLSSNDGNNDELLMVRITGEGNTYLAVSSDTGFGLPYSLRAEYSAPVDLPAIAKGTCSAEKLVKANEITDPETLSYLDTPTRLLLNEGENVMYVINPLRMISKYGKESWDNLYSGLVSLATSEQGKILAINESSLYEILDTSPCDINNGNAVALAIRGAVSAYRGTVQNVIMVGGDNMLPYYRVLDLSNLTERNYAALTPLKPGNPMYAAMFKGYILTDKVYSNDYDLALGGKTPLIPHWGVSRLVETPTEISQAIASKKTMSFNTALVSAYDIVEDSGKEIATTLSSILGAGNVTAVPDLFDFSAPWYATELRCYMLGKVYPGCQSHDVVSLNGHFTHNMVISQAAYENQPCNEASNESCYEQKYLTTHDIDTTELDLLAGKYIYSPGCHAGLSLSSTTGLDALDSAEYSDFPQSYVQQGVTYLAGTGYGIAGISSYAYSEKLMGLNTRAIFSGDSVGMAAAKADAAYLINAMLNGVDAYDIKAMYQSTLYGFANTALPARVDIPSPLPAQTCASEYPVAFNLSVLDGESVITHSSTMDKNCTSTGQHYTVNGQSKSMSQRPLEPVNFVGYETTGPAIHGYLLEQALYEELPVNPVFMTPTTDNSTNIAEQSFCQTGRYWPTSLVDVAGSATNTYLAVVSGQFVCQDENENNGLQRLYTDATIRILRSDSSDFIPPIIHSVDLRRNDLGNTVVAVNTTDNASGIKDIILTVYLDGSIKTIKAEPEVINGENPYLVQLTAEQAGWVLANNTVVSVIDGANNVATSSAKGRGMKQVLVDLVETPDVDTTIQHRTLSASIENYALRKAVAKSMSYQWDFGDGNFETGVVFDESGDNVPTVAINNDGTATLIVSHDYPSINKNYQARFKVTDSDGGNGADTLVIGTCGDALGDFDYANGDLVGCDVSIDGTNVTLTVKVREGAVIATDYQYRLYLDYTGDKVNDLKLTYDNNDIGKTNKVGNLSASYLGNTLTIKFDLAPTGWKAGDTLNWYMETQSGVEKGRMVGSGDTMPDTGYFTFY